MPSVFPPVLNVSGEVLTHVLRGVSLFGSKSRQLSSEHQPSQAVITKNGVGGRKQKNLFSHRAEDQSVGSWVFS